MAVGVWIPSLFCFCAFVGYMKSVADFKRALAVGVPLHTVYHVEPKRDPQQRVIRASDGLPEYTDKDMGIAQVSVVQSASFALARKRTDGTMADSWLSYPKASDCEFHGNSVTIFETCDRRGRVKVLTYTFV